MKEYTLKGKVESVREVLDFVSISPGISEPPVCISVPIRRRVYVIRTENGLIGIYSLLQLQVGEEVEIRVRERKLFKILPVVEYELVQGDKSGPAALVYSSNTELL